MTRKLTVVQMLPSLQSGGVERGTLELGRYLVSKGHRSIVISAGGRMLQQLEEEGSEHINWPVGAKKPGTLKFIKRIRTFLREEKPDILHVRSRLPAWIGYRAWKKMDPSIRPHFVTTVHGPYTVNWYSAVMTKGERVIAISNMIQNYITSSYPAVDPDIIRVIHRGVDRSEYYFEYKPDEMWLRAWYELYPVLKDQYVISLPARITRWKGQEHFLEIIHQLRKSGCPVHGLVIGEPHKRKKHFLEELEHKVQAMELGDYVTFTGHRSDLKNILAVSNVVLSLALDPEAFGRTTLEALSLGIPVAGYDHGGVAEQLDAILPEGKIPVGNTHAMVELIQKWQQNPPALIPEHPFTLDNMLDKTIAVYRELYTDA